MSARLRRRLLDVLMVLGGILFCSGPIAMGILDAYGVELSQRVPVTKPVYDAEGREIGYVVLREERRPTKVAWGVYGVMMLGVSLLVAALAVGKDCP